MSQSEHWNIGTGRADDYTIETSTMVNSNSNNSNTLSVSMATSDSPQHTNATTSYVNMTEEEGAALPQQHHAAGDATTSYVTMEEGRLREGSATVGLTVGLTAAATTTAAAAATTTVTTIKSIQDELMELFWELMDFNRHRNWKKKVLTVFMVVSTFFVVVDLLFLGHILDIIHVFAAWMSLHILPGTLLFIVLLTCCTLIMIPPSILMFVCGYVFTEVSGLAQGIPAACLASFAGCAVGAILAFLRARYMMRDLFQLFSKRYKIIRAVDKALEHNGFRVMLLLRLCPVVPFNGLNYIGGVTSISMEDFVFALVGTLPLILFTVVLGATAESLLVTQDDMTAQEYAVRRVKIVVSLLLVAVAVIITLYKAKKELVRELAAEQEAENAKKAVGNRDGLLIGIGDNRVGGGGNGDGDDPDSMNRPQDSEDQVEVTLREGIDDEEWFWFYS